MSPHSPRHFYYKQSGLATADNTRRRLSVDFLLNGGSDGLAAAVAALDATTTDAQCCDDATSVAGGTASASPSTNTSPRSSGAHATRTTRCADLLPPLSSLLSNSAPAVSTKAGAQAQREAHQQHGRRRSWSTGGVVRPSAFIPPLAAQSCWSGANPPPERRPVVTVASSGPLARGPPVAAASGQSSGFFLPINALPVVLDIDRDFEAAEREHRQRQIHQQLNQQRQQFQRQRRPQPSHPQHSAMTLAMMQKRKRERKAAGELDQDEVEVARTLADPNQWVSSAQQRSIDGLDHHPAFAAEAEAVISLAEDARRMQHYHHQAKRRRHSACTPTLVAEAQRLFSSHLATTPILPASEAKELAAAKYGTAAAGATSAAVDPMDETTTTTATTTASAAEQAPATATTGDTTTAATNVSVNDNAQPAIAPTYRKAEAFQFSPDQQDLLLQVLERTQQREAQRSTEAGGAHNSEMDVARAGRSSSISSGGGSSSGGSSSGDDGEANEDEDEAMRLQRMAKKRKRVNAQQLAVLEEYFAADPMPNTLAKLKLAETLGMSPKRVQIWFQNKRARLKKGEQKKLQDALQQQSNHAGSRLLTYHNLRIDDSGHIVIKDPISADSDGGGGESVTPTASAAQNQHQHQHQPQQQFVPIMPQPTTTASAT
jgi:hypothetical protein